MDISKIGQYAIKLDSDTSVEFENFTQFENWLKSEVRAWHWLITEETKVDSWTSGGRSVSPFTMTSVLTDTLRLAKMNLTFDSDQAASAVKEIELALENGTYIGSGTPKGKFLIEEGETDPAFGLKLLEVVLNKNRNFIPSDRQELLAIFALNDFERGFSKKRLKESIDESQKIVADLLRIQPEVVEALDNTKAELADFKAALKKEIALKEPIDYWSKKSDNHKYATVILALLFIGYSATALFFLANFIPDFKDGIQGFIASWKDTGVGAVASFAGLIGIGMVIARVLYRLFASQLHLWNDARERVTMIQTYLALAAEGHAKEEFLGALMQRLFSPSSDGIVKSDLGAVGPLDGIIKQFGNK